MADVGFDDLIGIPFVNYGRDREGCDCWGVVRLTFEKFGISVPDYHISCFAAEKISRQIENDKPYWQRIERSEAPCLVVMALVPELPRVCNHLGAYIGFGQFIHTMKKINSSIERITHPFFSQRIRGYYRYVG